MIKDWTDTIIQQWLTQNVKLNGSSTFHELREAEKSLDFTFPDEFKQLYLKVNGFFDWDMTINMISRWPIDRIIQEYKGNNDKNFVGFCDYLINSHEIGFYKIRNGIFKATTSSIPLLCISKKFWDSSILTPRLFIEINSPPKNGERATLGFVQVGQTE